MPIHQLTKKLWFPPVTDALQDGLLAIGGDLSPQRLLLAYKSGIFPWYNEDEPPLWWCPNPRFVLFPDELKVSKSMKQVIKSKQFEWRMDKAFETVIQNCSQVYREGQGGTWITPQIIENYTLLFNMGVCHSSETWMNGMLVGGLYGVWLGNIFFGESMFSLVSNASKFAFIYWVQYLKSMGVVLIDCQVFTEHLESLGATMIKRTEFINILQKEITS